MNAEDPWDDWNAEPVKAANPWDVLPDVASVADGRDGRVIAKEWGASTHSCPDHAGFVRFTDSLNRLHLRAQCSVCGAAVAVKKCEAKSAPLSSLPDYDPDLAVRWNNRAYEFGREIHEHQRETARREQLAAFREEENAFLRTPRWAEMRRLVLEREGGLCQGCRKRRATQVHHLHYERLFGHELLIDLVAFCDGCHKKSHDAATRRPS